MISWDLGWALHPNGRCPSKRKAEGDLRAERKVLQKPQGGRDDRPAAKKQALLAVTRCWKASSLNSSEGGVALPGLHTSGLQKGQRMNSCCWKPPHLRRFVAATVRN